MSPDLDSPADGVTSDAPPSPDWLALTLLQGGDTDRILMRLRAALAAFDPWTPPARDAGLLLAALAACQPLAISPDSAIGLATVILRADLSQTRQPAVDEAFGLLALLVATPAHQLIPGLAQEILLVPGLHPRWFWKTVELLQALLDWQPNVLTVPSLLAIAECIEKREASALFHSILVPLLLADPSGHDLDLIQRASALVEEPYEARYLLAALIDHDGTSEELRSWARDLSADWFPLRDIWRNLFNGRPLHLLCVQNIADGQGDEMIRTVPLLQALLDDHPESDVRLITDRAYLYHHPRIETISFDDHARIDAVLSQPLDGLIEFCETRVFHLNHDPDLAQAFAALRTRSDLRFDLKSDKGWNQFTFQSVQIDGFEWSAALQFDRLLDQSVYDPVFRLLMELGLRLRIGERPLRSESVLIDERWSDAERGWHAANSNNIEQRPVALLNPFGGSSRLKGFTPAKFDDLADLVLSLIADGYFVTICPSGTTWGSSSLIDVLLARLPEHARHFIGRGPEPATLDSGETGQSPAQPGMQSSETMQSLMSFVARAALIVTIEGWMMHAAFLLGKPYRLLLLPESGDRIWQPWGRSHKQRAWLFHGDATLDRPPLPEKPRKNAWLEWLSRISDPACAPFLLDVARTFDPDIRKEAVQAYARVGGVESVAYLRALLEDRSLRIRVVAAEALLNFHRETLGRDGVPEASILEAYRLLCVMPFPDWEGLIRQGTTALPALRAALHGDDSVIRREAAVILERISRGWFARARRSADACSE